MSIPMYEPDNNVVSPEIWPPAMRGFNYDVVEGKPTGAKIVGLAQTLPMMAAYRMVVVRDLGLMPADEAEPLLAYFAKPNPSTVIVAMTSKLDKRLKTFATVSKKGWLHVRLTVQQQENDRIKYITHAEWQPSE